MEDSCLVLFWVWLIGAAVLGGVDNKHSHTAAIGALALAVMVLAHRVAP